jgi:predicted RecB family nuclease
MYYESDSGILRFSPSDLTVFLETEFASWMDRWESERLRGNPDVVAENGLPIGLELPGINSCHPDEKDEQLKLIAAKGMEHEYAFLDRLRQKGHDIAEFKTLSKNVVETVDAMRQRKDFIYQARLEHEDFAGYADFLARKSGESFLGDHHYEAWDTKLSRSPKGSFIIQLCAYSEMLEHLQGHRPEEFEVVLGNNEHIRYFTKQFIYYFRSLKRTFLEFHENFDASQFPHPGLSKSFGRWNAFAEQVLNASDHLSGVANISRSQIKKLEAAEVTTMSDLARSKVEHVPGLPKAILRRLKTQARLQVESAGETRPCYEILQPSPQFPRRGLGLLPPSSSMDVYFDIEGFPLHHGGLEYLLGVVYLEEGNPRFTDWWAHNDTQEKLAFEGFVDWVYERWLNDPEMHIFHYAAYEVTALRKLMGKYATREREVDNLLRNQVFVDLFKIVSQGLIVGTSSYSLKDIEGLYRDVREGEVTTAGGSVVAYNYWLESEESEAWQESEILKEIRDYNEVDCISTWELAEWLRNAQSEAKISYFASDDKSEENQLDGDREEEHPAKLLSNRLLKEVESGQVAGEENINVQRLLAWLLEFHWRESKPVFWRMFDRHEKTDVELVDDLDCLGGLRRTPKPPVPIKRSFLYEYRFDPAQDTKLHIGSSCYFAHDLKVGTTIENLAPKDGLVEIKLSPKVKEEPESLSLIPNEHVSSKIISDAVFRYVEAWSDGNVLSQAVDDLLHRRQPRINGQKPGPIVPEGSDLLPAVVDVVRRMDRTTLCIQGPPGTGKTYTTARAILQLLKDKKKVAITANSHKVILNVLEAIYEAMNAEGVSLHLVKVGGAADDPLIQTGAIQHIPESKKAVDALGTDPIVMGGTAWVFSRAELQGAFDYLFVEEAGQFSLANVVATGLSANNIVLVGDQMQLSQPTMGTHPGESSLSALEYLLKKHATIPPELGIFLNETRRMHPDVCNFISDAIYESKLHSHPDTSNQQVTIPDSIKDVVPKGTGIAFVPVEHEGNTQGSDEEVDLIERIVEELIGQTVHQFAGQRTEKIKQNDILVVAPFNMQVRQLQNRLGAHARVGSVDKFQGQEAHIVIISMCSSTLDDSPRGAEFLLDPNRLNVAVSRARSLAIVVGSPSVLSARCQTIKEMELLNLYCWLVEYAGSHY